jgi:MFS family permease
MSILALVEDRPTPKAVYNWRVYLTAFTAASAAIMIGYDSAFIGGTLALKSFKDEFDFENKSASEVSLLSANIVSCYQAGAFFGAFAAYPAGHFYGRRWGLFGFAAIFVLGAGMMLGANGQRGLGLIYGGRVLAGFGIGGASNLSVRALLALRAATDSILADILFRNRTACDSWSSRGTVRALVADRWPRRVCESNTPHSRRLC